MKFIKLIQFFSPFWYTKIIFKYFLSKFKADNIPLGLSVLLWLQIFGSGVTGLLIVQSFDAFATNDSDFVLKFELIPIFKKLFLFF